MYSHIYLRSRCSRVALTLIATPAHLLLRIIWPGFRLAQCTRIITPPTSLPSHEPISDAIELIIIRLPPIQPYLLNRAAVQFCTKHFRHANGKLFPLRCCVTKVEKGGNETEFEWNTDRITLTLILIEKCEYTPTVIVITVFPTMSRSPVSLNLKSTTRYNPNGRYPID